MKIIDLGGGLYDIEVGGRKVGRVWQRSYDLTWQGAVLDEMPVGSHVGFLTKGAAVKAVLRELP